MTTQNETATAATYNPAIGEAVAAKLCALTPAEVREHFERAEADTDDVIEVARLLADAHEALTARAAVVADALDRLEQAAQAA